MIITLVILAIDWLVLTLNEIPWLPYHCFYLAGLIVRLRFSKQPDTYNYTVDKAETVLKAKNNSSRLEVAECKICCQAKPPRYYHCRHCNSCIYRLDHHCGFVGNCVGQYNFKVYVHLLINGFFHATVVSLLMLLNFKEMMGLQSTKGFYWLLVLPGLFGLYETGRLLKSFWDTVKRNQTLI
jgi:hypothetical protein